MADEIVRGKPGEPEPQNPSLAYEDSSITAYVVATSWTVFPSASDLGWTKDGYFFTGWNTAADGTGTAYAVGDACAHPFVVFAQWAVNSDYLTTTEELTFIANAIRTKGGTSASLAFPSDFATAIAAIPTGITPTGTISITSAGTTDVTNYATASVAAGSAATPATSITANPSISVSSGGLITASVSTSQSVTPTVSSGFVTSGTAGTMTVSGSNTSQLSTQAAQTLHPSTSDQTVSAGKYLTGAQTFKGVLLTNLSAANIASGVTVKVGDSTDDDCVTSVTGTHSGSSWTLVASNEFTVSTTSTSQTLVGNIAFSSSAVTIGKIVWVKIRDKAGGRAGYFYGSDNFYYVFNSSPGSMFFPSIGIITKRSNGWNSVQNVKAGVYSQSLSATGSVYIHSLYNSGQSTTIDGTFTVEVYTLDYPDSSPFA